MENVWIKVSISNFKYFFNLYRSMIASSPFSPGSAPASLFISVCGLLSFKSKSKSGWSSTGLPFAFAFLFPSSSFFSLTVPILYFPFFNYIFQVFLPFPFLSFSSGCILPPPPFSLFGGHTPLFQLWTLESAVSFTAGLDGAQPPNCLWCTLS